jgi:hypothetical protein
VGIVINFNSYKKDLFLLGFQRVRDKREKGEGCAIRVKEERGTA